MSGHYRVASPGAQVGQPEVKLGLIPGAAGTQRLPRLAGVTKAVEMCAEGNPVKAPEAFKLGIVDRLIEGDLLTGVDGALRGDEGRGRRGLVDGLGERTRRGREIATASREGGGDGEN